MAAEDDALRALNRLLTIAEATHALVNAVIAEQEAQSAQLGAIAGLVAEHESRLGDLEGLA